MKMKKICSILILMMLSLISLQAASVHMSVQSGRGKRSVEVGDQFYILLEVRDSEAKPEIPKSFPGAKLLYFDRTGQSSSYQSVNGHTTMSYSFTYTITLRALKEGSYSFGPVTAGGARSNVVKYSIGKEQPTPSQPSQQGGAMSSAAAGSDDDKPKFIGKGDGNLFLRANVSKTSAFEQEALVYTVKLYTTYDAVKFIGATAAPKFDGFTVEESKDISTSLSFETYQGKSYATAIIARYIIFPQMTGPLKVTGNTYTISVDRREYYHDPFWGGMSISTPLQLNVTPNDLTVNVRALPAPRPADFSGGVGQFSISSSLKQKEFKINQAASIVYTVKGTGNIKYLQMPDLNALFPPEIEVYTPKTDQQVNVGSSNTSGTVTFDYSFMPLEEGTFKIPDVNLVYYNPATGKYETAVAKGYTITVGKGAETKDGASKARARFVPDLEPVKISALKKQHDPMVYGFPYWLWYIIPALLFVAALIAYRVYISQHADMAAFNSRRADKLARRRLKRAEAAMKRRDTENYYAELLKAIWGYLGDKLKMPTSELLRDNIRQVLSEKQIPAESIDSLISLIDDAEFARYSSMGAGTENMETIYRRAIQIINTLEKDFKNKSGQAAASYASSAASAAGKGKTLLWLLLILCSSSFANAGIKEAETAYAKGDYSSAIAQYNGVIDSLGSSAPLLADLGNAYVKAGDYGRAMIAYQRALIIDPGNSLAGKNVKYLDYRVEENNRSELRGKKLSVEPDQPSFFQSIKDAVCRGVASNTWATWGAICFVAFVVCLAMYIFCPVVLAKKIGFFAGFILLGISILLVVFSFSAASAADSHDRGVVTAYKVNLLTHPSLSAKKNPCALTRGTMMRVLDTEKNQNGEIQWVKVRLNSDYVGWVSAADFEVI